jgi:hypothetical protein
LDIQDQLVYKEIKVTAVAREILVVILAREDILAALAQAVPKDRAVQLALLAQLADIPVVEDILVVLA